jgi:hypothetical protein
MMGRTEEKVAARTRTVLGFIIRSYAVDSNVVAITNPPGFFQARFLVIRFNDG